MTATSSLTDFFVPSVTICSVIFFYFTGTFCALLFPSNSFCFALLKLNVRCVSHTEANVVGCRPIGRAAGRSEHFCDVREQLLMPDENHRSYEYFDSLSHAPKKKKNWDAGQLPLTIKDSV